MYSVQQFLLLVALSVLVPKVPARIPCAAHQNVEGLGGSPNQPNVITQSVTWVPGKKGAAEKDCPTFDAEFPPEDVVLDSAPRIASCPCSRCRQCRQTESREVDDDFDLKIRRLVKLLGNMRQERSRYSDWPSPKCYCRAKNPRYSPVYSVANDSEEDDDCYPVRTPKFKTYYDDVDSVPAVRRRSKPLRVCECEDYDDEEELPRRKTPKEPPLSWMILKKPPKRCSKRLSRDEDDRRDVVDEATSRDILYLPQSSPNRGKYRKISDYLRR